MDDVINTETSAPGRGFGDQTGGRQDAGRNLVNPTGLVDADAASSDLNPLPIDDEADDLDDEDDMSDRPGLDSGTDMDEDDEIDLPGIGAPEIGDDRGRRIVQDPMMDDAADLPYAPSR